MKHTVYIQEKPLIFFPVYEADQLPKDNTYEVISEEDTDWITLIERFEKKEINSGLYCLCANPDQAWISFCSKFDLIVGAGGLVKNEEGKYLLIYRRGKWDLPKGKLDYDEMPEAAAMREVEEETGIGQLEIKKEISISFYIYTEKARRKLKKTHWYLMETTSAEIPKPQIDEDIQEAKWMDVSEIKSVAWPNTYHTIQGILKQEIELS